MSGRLDFADRVGLAVGLMVAAVDGPLLLPAELLWLAWAAWWLGVWHVGVLVLLALDRRGRRP